MRYAWMIMALFWAACSFSEVIEAELALVMVMLNIIMVKLWSKEAE